MKEKEENNLDKYTSKILKHIDLEKPPHDFTEKIMGKILLDKIDAKKFEAFGSKRFFLFFSIVFFSIVLLAGLLPSGEYSMPESINTAKDVLSQFKIDFSFLSGSVFSTIKDNVLVKILPFAIIVLIIFEKILLRYSDSWKA